MEKKLVTCYLIGEDRLLLECAEILLSYNHSILGIISPLPAAEEFSIQKKIPYFLKVSDAVPILSVTAFDYLFSIINGTVLPLSLLEQAKCMAINYHNGPLPRYAGLHAPSWAILHNERVHGVTWHQMVKDIDAGAILKQAPIEIEADETGLSLSVKCYQEALNTFKELVYEISFQQLRPIPQNLENRSYFDYCQKPMNGGWISWHDSAETIDRMCRALNLGQHHRNRFSLPKFNIGKNFFLILQLHILDEENSHAPGTLVEITAQYWQIATKTRVVQLEQILSFHNETVNFIELAERFHLKKGSVLPPISEKSRLEYKYFCEVYAIHELFWVRQEKSFIPATLPFQTLSLSPEKNYPLKQVAMFNASTLFSFPTNEYPNNPCNILFAALYIYLYRLGNKEKFGVGFSHPLLQQLPEAIKPLFAQIIPFSFQLNEDLTVEETLKEFFDRLLKFDKHLSFSRDIFVRYPELSSNLQSFYPITVMIGHEKGFLKRIHHINSSVVVTISNTYKIQWFSREKNDDLDTILRNSIQHLPILIASMLEHPTMLISQLPLLSAKESSQLLMTWNKTQISPSQNKSVVQLFVEQVQKTPEQIALSYEGQVLSYQALNDQSNQFARLLQKNGLSAGQHVVICTNQEIHLIVGLLAILKIGAAYVPIDTNYPSSHIQFILSDSSATVAIASKSLKAKMQICCDNQNVPLIIFENFIKSASAESSENLNLASVDPDSLAYIIYTSGTTGKPKGVMIPHRGIVRLVNSTNYIKITKNDRIAQAASISFDAATFEIWGALLNGATLVAVPHATLVNVTQFSQFLIKKKITVLWLTSALFNQYASVKPSMFATLSYLLIGGDILNAEQVMRVLRCEKGAPRQILNGYGPTENTTFTTTYLIKARKEGYQSIPIGKPIANSTVYILDKYLRPTPIGAPGELYTGGAGVALGYLNRPEITTARFIPNLFDSSAETLLYKTGDIVRWMPDGNIEYLSRQDNQIKIRGFRVELEAVCTVLLHHEAVDQCAVRVCENEKQQKSIVAYLVLKHECPMINIKQYMASQLPKYMIPSFFIRIDKIPLTLNGKVDFEKLPAPDSSTNTLTSEYVAPQTQTEKEIEKIWSELFELDQIGIHDSFFDLGGHSLMVSQLVLKVKEQLLYDLSLQQFLEKPTIFHLAQLIEINEEIKPSSFMAHWKFDIELNLPHCLRVTKPNIFSDFPSKREREPNFLQELEAANVQPKALLLTGANGFLGANLLKQLYQLTSATIYCLVRGANLEDAKNKLQKSIELYDLHFEDKERIQLLVGDLGKPYLGLPIEEFMVLAEKIDIIYHNGAAVHHLYSYEMLRAANVLSVKEILKLATIKKLIPIHYISTLSAASNYLDNFNSIIEDFIYSHPNPPPEDGYSQTKWIAEQILAKAHQQQIPIKIYRPAWILGDSISGLIAAEQNHLLRLIKGCCQLGYAPSWDIELDILPVDYVGQMIVKTSLNTKIPYSLFNLVNTNKLSWKELITYLNQRGYNMQLISPNAWQKKLLTEMSPESTLYSLLTLYINQSDNVWMEKLDRISSANNQNTHYAFQANGMKFPFINKQLLDNYFNFLEKRGFLAIKVADVI